MTTPAKDPTPPGGEQTPEAKAFEVAVESGVFRVTPDASLNWPARKSTAEEPRYWKVTTEGGVVLTLPADRYPTAEAARREVLACLTGPTSPVLGGPMNGQRVTASLGRVLLDHVRDGGHYELRGDVYEWKAG